MRRPLAVAAAAMLATLPLSAMPAHALELIAKPIAGAPAVMRVNGRAVQRAHRSRWHHHSAYVANGFQMMYVVHRYPRGIVPIFGYPRPCDCRYVW